MPHAISDGRSQNHAQPADLSPAGRSTNDASGRKCAAAGQEHDIPQELHAASLAAVLIVNLGVYVVGIG